MPSCLKPSASAWLHTPLLGSRWSFEGKGGEGGWLDYFTLFLLFWYMELWAISPSPVLKLSLSRCMKGLSPRGSEESPTCLRMLKANQSVWSSRALWGLAVRSNDEFSYATEYTTQQQETWSQVVYETIWWACNKTRNAWNELNCAKTLTHTTHD